MLVLAIIGWIVLAAAGIAFIVLGIVAAIRGWGLNHELGISLPGAVSVMVGLAFLWAASVAAPTIHLTFPV